MLHIIRIILVLSYLLCTAPVSADDDFYVIPVLKPTSARVNVYDANNQYIGIAMGLHEFFIPSMNKFYNFSDKLPESDGFYFSDTNCTGVFLLTPEIAQGLGDLIVRNYRNNKFYAILDWVASSEIYSSRFEGWTCSNSSGIEVLVKTQEVTLPFTVPVARPLRYAIE